MLNGIQTACSNYYQEIPANSLQAICRSAIFSFVASLIIANQPHQTAVNFARPIMAASVGALASTINALTAPFFNWMFGNKEYRIYQEAIRMFVDLSIAQNLINFGTTNKVNLFAPHLAAKIVKYFCFSHNVFIKIPLAFPAAVCSIFSDSYAGRYKNYFYHNGIDIENAIPSIYFTV